METFIEQRGLTIKEVEPIALDFWQCAQSNAITKK
jgi:hypothetical protein